MGVLTGFERRLEGAVEGMFARLFKSGLQPIELAQGVQRYATDHRHVTSTGVVVPNDYRISINSADAARLSAYGGSLVRELGNVVRETAADHDWQVPGDVTFDTIANDEIAVGTYRMVGRVRAPHQPSTTSQPAGSSQRSIGEAPAAPTPVAEPPVAAPPTPEAPAAADPQPAAASPDPTPGETQLLPPNGVGGARPTGGRTIATPDLHLEVVDTGQTLDLIGGRYVIGRLDGCDLAIDSTTVSREHAALVKRHDTWWVVDLGSTNGTKVNGVRASEQPVRAGDRIEVGTIDLTARKG